MPPGMCNRDEGELEGARVAINPFIQVFTMLSIHLYPFHLLVLSHPSLFTFSTRKVVAAIRCNGV